MEQHHGDRATRDGTRKGMQAQRRWNKRARAMRRVPLDYWPLVVPQGALTTVARRATCLPILEWET